MFHTDYCIATHRYIEADVQTVGAIVANLQNSEGRIMNLKGRNFLTLKDFTPEEITYLIDLSADVKEKKKNGIPVDK